MSALPAITVVCALPSEAQALVGHWRLALRRERPFRVYGDGPARVVVSGVGSHASAAAVGYAAGLADAGGDHMWLNLGIAGHVSHAVGTPLLAARITHHGREGAWYPSLLFLPVIATDTGAEALLARWHFTHAQTLQLRQLLQRRALLTAQATPDLSSLVSCRDASALLARLREEVDALPLPAARTR
ncbi:MAG: hypothetical protein IPM80_01920 [Proteobacteria bacterium]|nr:hypothetical protein [Pseudomonadota bacterium]